jgi:hypothetical protein
MRLQQAPPVKRTTLLLSEAPYLYSSGLRMLGAPSHPVKEGVRILVARLAGDGAFLTATEGALH